MVDLMRNLGVEPVPTVGTPFDPEVHEAIMREASSEHPDGTVLVEFRKGFKIGEKLLRPAMVQVRSSPAGVGNTSAGITAGPQEGVAGPHADYLIWLLCRVGSMGRRICSLQLVPVTDHSLMTLGQH